jgi:GTP pyrophosphokinase
MVFSIKFDQALAYTAVIHAGQVRHKTRMPALAHLMGVAGLALEYGANEQEAIAALLHDAVEDAGGEDRLKDIRARFGDNVADIVAGCTASAKKADAPWRDVKQKFITGLGKASSSVRLVAACDKLHNARALLRNLRVQGESLWRRYPDGKDGALWYFRSLTQAFKKHGPASIGDELDRVIREIEVLASKKRSTGRTLPP